MRNGIAAIGCRYVKLKAVVLARASRGQRRTKTRLGERFCDFRTALGRVHMYSLESSLAAALAVHNIFSLSKRANTAHSATE